jgi:hypothetical protein
MEFKKRFSSISLFKKRMAKFQSDSSDWCKKTNAAKRTDWQ